MTTGQTERRGARSLAATYLNIALEVSEASCLGKHEPQIISALIIAQSIDRHSKVSARETRLATTRIVACLEVLDFTITEYTRRFQA